MNGMTLIVKTITRLVLGFIIIYSGSIILYGHLTPGGGFAGGVMLACAFILLVLAMGKNAALDIVTENKLSAWDCIGALAFLAIALIGYVTGDFFTNFIVRGTPLRLISGGTIMWSNIAIGIKVSASLFAVFIALACLRLTGER